jgi:hypothetical protein
MSRVIKNPSIVSGGIIYTSYENANLTANTNNLSIGNLASNVLIRLTSSGNYNLTGIVNPDGLGREIQVFNVGVNNITFKDNDAGSSAGNRFFMGADKVVQPQEGITFVYDVVDLKWRSSGVNI